MPQRLQITQSVDYLQYILSETLRLRVFVAKKILMGADSTLDSQDNFAIYSLVENYNTKSLVEILSTREIKEI